MTHSQSELSDKALLPTGLRDLLPPEAAFEADTVARLMNAFAAHGYQQVKPPMIEFEESLLGGAGGATANQTFRLMDPISQRMMGLRPDMTVQVGRIATTRLGGAPRPLRLTYAGQVLRVRGTQLRPERQLGQVGAELIGPNLPTADAEVIVMAAGALSRLGIDGLSVDLGLPTLVPTILAASDIDPEMSRHLSAAISQKDASDIAALGAKLDDPALERTLSALLDSVGQADGALSALEKIDLPPDAARLLGDLTAVVAAVRAQAPDLPITVDAVETRGFEYYTGVNFTLFARAQRGELGNGGRYLAGGSEPATGLTLFTDTLVRIVERPPEQARVYLPLGTPGAEAAQLRDRGWIVLAGLAAIEDAKAEATRLNCSHVFIDGRLLEL